MPPHDPRLSVNRRLTPELIAEPIDGLANVPASAPRNCYPRTRPIRDERYLESMRRESPQEHIISTAARKVGWIPYAVAKGNVPGPFLCTHEATESKKDRGKIVDEQTLRLGKLIWRVDCSFDPGHSRSLL